ncbi:MAG: type II secretion system secretin GspD [Limnohabitans sp.]
MKRLSPQRLRPASGVPLRPFCTALALSAALLGHVALAQGPGKPAVKPGEPVTLNFVNAEIEAVARTVATLSGANVVVDPSVKGTMTLTSTLPVPPGQALRLFSAQLRTQGFALVENSGIHTVVPEADAKLQSGPVHAGPAPAGGGQIVTQIFRLNHESASTLVPVLRPLISPNNTINVTPGSNSLVITDYADNLQRLGRIVAALDVANATGVDVIRLQHGIASDMAPMVQRLLDASAAGAGASMAPGQGGEGFRTTVLADARTNTLIVRAANPARLGLVRTLVDQLDLAPAGGPGAASGNIHVVYLRNADATKLATTLRAALAADGRTGAAGMLTSGGGAVASSPSTLATTAGGNSSIASGTGSLSPSAQPSTGGQIQADPATNSLIITAPEPQYRQLREVIDRLDQRRAQVFVESLIAEISEDKAAEFGIQWQGPIGQKGDGSIGLLGTNFSVGGTNILQLASQPLSATNLPATGGNFGVANRLGNGTYVLGFLARFLQSTGDGNVLSTPNLLTLDNEEAKIVIGQNVPFVTGQYTNANATGSTVNPFQTIERKDVGLTLKVKPQISESGTIKMQIYQEVSSIDTSVASSSGLITNKRSIESNVLVEDGNIIVLGGLLQDTASNNQQRVPGLGDIPVLGYLFKAEARSRKKTNLMLFLRPVVVRDGAAAEALSVGRYEQMRTVQSTNPANASFGAAILPPVVPAPQPAKP